MLIHVVANDKITFFFMTEQYAIIYRDVCVCVCVCHIFVIHSSISGHLVCFHILAIIKHASIHIGAHGSFQIGVFVFFGITGSDDISNC